MGAISFRPPDLTPTSPLTTAIEAGEAVPRALPSTVTTARAAIASLDPGTGGELANHRFEGPA